MRAEARIILGALIALMLVCSWLLKLGLGGAVLPPTPCGIKICFVVHCIIPNEPVMTNMLPLLTKMRISFSCLTEVLVECMDRVCMAGFAQSFKIFESLGKTGYAFQGLESL